MGSDAPFTVRDGLGGEHDLEAGTIRFGPGLRVRPDAEPLQGPLVFSGRNEPLELEGKPYRGTFEVIVDKGRLRVVNHVALEAYLFGVVPREVPASWPGEALKAQAVVARSYALAVRRSGGIFDLFADVRSQVYGGLSAEAPETTAAVLATAGQVVLFEGKVATTYFFSTSGGRTANIEDVWPGSSPVPYLVSVPDPYDASSPHHAWGPFGFTGRRLARVFGLAAPPVDGGTTLNASGRATELVLVGPDGAETAIPASTVRAKLGLRSTWFSAGVLGLTPPARRVLTFGSRLVLAGIARGLTDVVLEQRPLGGIWERAALVVSAGDGSFSLSVKPTLTTDYRLVSGKITLAPLRILVAPLVRLETPRVQTALGGTVRPVLPGTSVIVQRQAGTRWVRAASATVGEDGRFEAALELVPGTYRARIAPGGGYAVGVSPVLNVVAP